MPKYQMIIHGVNFRLPEDGSPEPPLMGFHVCACIEAATAEAAEREAMDLLRKADALRGTVRVEGDEAARMFVDELWEVDEWRADIERPLTGFIFYRETEGERG